MKYVNITQKGNELWINGHKVDQPKSRFFNNCVVQVNGKIYVNGKEFKNGKWRYTLKSLLNSLF